MLRRRLVRVLVALSGVVLVTYVAYRVIPVNATTVGFAYLLLILIVASTWGFLESQPKIPAQDTHVFRDF